MVWIESHQSLAAHPKTKRLARFLGISRPQAIGHLHLLWWWAVDYAEDGYLDRYDDNDIADALEWEGDPSAIGEALVHAGFVDSLADGRRRIHDWDQYIGRLVARREADRERKRKAQSQSSAGVPPERAKIPSVTNSNQQTDQPTATNQAGEDAVRRCADAWTHATNQTVTAQQWENIEAWVERVGEAWVLDAIRKTGDAGGKRWSYTKAILESWELNGRDDSPRNGTKIQPCKKDGCDAPGVERGWCLAHDPMEVR